MVFQLELRCSLPRHDWKLQFSTAVIVQMILGIKSDGVYILPGLCNLSRQNVIAIGQSP